jgi:inorganic pyrophosphatase
MSQVSKEAMLSTLYRPHPWHGVPIGAHCPRVVTAYIEIVPTDTVKYELDKLTGYLRVDRPQKYSNICPTLYGLVPQTLSAERVAALSGERTGKPDPAGDGDPLDICVLTVANVLQGDILLQAVPIGGLHMLDGREADDKIVAVLEGDPVYGAWKDISECPAGLLDRLKHYFLTYKEAPDAVDRTTEITHVYGASDAHRVIEASRDDYRTHLSELVRLSP